MFTVYSVLICVYTLRCFYSEASNISISSQSCLWRVSESTYNLSFKQLPMEHAIITTRHWVVYSPTQPAHQETPWPSHQHLPDQAGNSVSVSLIFFSLGSTVSDILWFQFLTVYFTLHHVVQAHSCCCLWKDFFVSFLNLSDIAFVYVLGYF